MNKTDSGSTLAFSGLPKPFLEAMAKLFDMLDENGDGWIQYSDVARRWHPCHAKLNQNLPKNILENLKKVTTERGFLSFERFCAGLKIAILRHEAERNRLIKSTDLQRSEQSDLSHQQDIENANIRPKGSSSRHVRTNSSSSQHNSTGKSSDISDRSLPFSPINRTNSLPNLVDGFQPLRNHNQLSLAPSPVPSEPWTLPNHAHYGPPKPPRDPQRISSTSLNEVGRNVEPSKSLAEKKRKGPHRRRDGHQRRHTLNGGAELSMANRINQWEEERLIVKEGLTIIQNVAEVYNNRLEKVQDKLEGVMELKTVASPHSKEAFEERQMFELQNLKDLNIRLQQMMERPITPVHMKSQSQTYSMTPSTLVQNEMVGALATAEARIAQMERQIQRLKEQNKELTKEVGAKSNSITNLERDKSVLIRQLFQARAPATLRPSTTAQISQNVQFLTRKSSVTSTGSSQQFGDDDESTIM